MKRLSVLLSLVMTILLLGVSVTSARAHAMLMSSSPEENAMLASPPSQVELTFSEAIDPKLSKISVMDSNNKRVDAGDSQVDPADATHLMVSLPPLSDGVYMVMWCAISATDGHQTTGSYPFSIGNVAANAMASIQQGPANNALPPGIIATKALLYLAVAALVGAILFTFLVWNPAIKSAQIPPEATPYASFSRKLLKGAAITLAIADVLGVFAQAGQVNGALIGWPWQPTFITVLLDTRFGGLAIARLSLALLLMGLLLGRPNRWNRWVGLAAGLLLMLTFSLESHAAAEPLPILPVLADWAHFSAISVWVGGLMSFLASIWAVHQLEPETRTRLTAELIPNFTRLAMTSVGIISLTGLYASYLRIGSPVALLDTTYGKVLLIKLAIILPMLGFGGVHFLITTPLIRRAARQPGGNPRLVGLFRGLLATETLLGVMVLIVVSIFTTMPPARTVATSSGYSKTTQAGDLNVTLKINPGRPGINTFTATITSNGWLVTDAQDVSLEFNNLSGMVPASKAAMTAVGNGVYTLKGGYLGMPDQWDVKVVVRRPGKFDAYAIYKVNIKQPVSRAIPWRPVGIGLSLAAVMCGLFAILASSRFPTREWSWN